MTKTCVIGIEPRDHDTPTLCSTPSQMPRPDLSPTDDELAPYLARMREVLQPREDDKVFIVLKSHLLFEELIREFINKQFKHPEALRDARLSFSQLLKIAQASSVTLLPTDWRWSSLHALNRLRNVLAHDFEAASAETLSTTVITTINDGNSADGYMRNPDSGLPSEPIPPRFALAMAINILYASLCVRLGFDAEFRARVLSRELKL